MEAPAVYPNSSSPQKQQGSGLLTQEDSPEQAPGAAQSCAGRSPGAAPGPQVMGARSLLRWLSDLPVGEFSLLLPETCPLWLMQRNLVPQMAHASQVGT